MLGCLSVSLEKINVGVNTRCLIQNGAYFCFIRERREELEKETRGRVVQYIDS